MRYFSNAFIRYCRFVFALSYRCVVCCGRQVSSWITHVIITQPTHDDRKAVLSCILRLAQTCWNTGNFNTATQIIIGLR